MNENLEKDMTPILLKDLGMRYPTEKSKEKKRYGLYQCQYCGKEFETVSQGVKGGSTKSCGCYRKSIIKELGHSAKTHGLRNHPIYTKWSDMKARCYNKNNKDYVHYGERGIEICPEWRYDFKSFYIWAMDSGWVSGLSIDRIDRIDRIDTNLSYSPNNCRWSTQYTQTQNIRDIKSNNTPGFRGVTWHKSNNKWVSVVKVNKKRIYLGSYMTSLEAAKAYETYVRLNKLEHNFTPALTEDEIEEINKEIEGNRC